MLAINALHLSIKRDADNKATLRPQRLYFDKQGYATVWVALQSKAKEIEDLSNKQILDLVETIYKEVMN